MPLLFVLVFITKTRLLGWEMSKEKMGVEGVVFDCEGDFPLYLSVSQWQTLALGLGLVVAAVLSFHVRRKSEALTTLHK